jgi:hypothetical protein
MELPPLDFVSLLQYILLCMSRVVHIHAHPGAGVLDPCGLTARSDPPVVPSGPLGVSPDPLLCPLVLVVSLCPPVPLVSFLIPPRVLRCPWCLLDPTVV